MVEIKYREKVALEAEDFARLYAEFYADYGKNFKKAYVQKCEGDFRAPIEYSISDAWTYLFAASIESLDKKRLRSAPTAPLKDEQPAVARKPDEVVGLFLDASLKAAVLETVRSLNLNELRLGGIVTNDAGVHRALKDRKLTEADLEPLYKVPYAKQAQKGKRTIVRPKVDGSDPFFWRTLLEVFCRAYVAAAGRPPEWSNKRILSLGFDLIEIQSKFFKDRKWSRKAALTKLKSTEPYKSRYKDGAKWKVSLKAVNDVAKRIEPMDGGAFGRLRELCEESFQEEFEQRLFRVSPKNINELLKVIKSNRAR